jgi:hypothetical protein
MKIMTTSRIDRIHNAMKQDVIAGHKEAIAKLKTSINHREHNLNAVTYLAPPVRIAFNRMHLAEIHQLEILELELRGIENGFTH